MNYIILTNFRSKGFSRKETLEGHLENKVEFPVSLPQDQRRTVRDFHSKTVDLMKTVL